MKKRTLTQFLAAAAGLALPLTAFTQDLSGQPGSGNVDSSAETSGSTDQSPGISGNSMGGGFSGNNSQSSPNQPGTFSGGIMVHDGAAYIVHRLQNEMSLPDGSKIQPNGVIRENDGSTRSISSGKILTLDGREMEAPFKSEESSSIPGSSGVLNSPSTPGASTGIGGSSTTSGQNNQSNTSTPPSTSSPNEELPYPNSTSDQWRSGTNPTTGPSGQNNGSNLAPGSISTDSNDEFTD